MCLAATSDNMAAILIQSLPSQTAAVGRLSDRKAGPVTVAPCQRAAGAGFHKVLRLWLLVSRCHHRSLPVRQRGPPQVRCLALIPGVLFFMSDRWDFAEEKWGAAIPSFGSFLWPSPSGWRCCVHRMNSAFILPVIFFTIEFQKVGLN